MATGEYRLSLVAEMDVTRASMQARRSALAMGFDAIATGQLVTTASELGTNVLKYAVRGEIVIRPIEQSGRRGLLIQATDHGPGIRDIDEALLDHHSTGGTLGLGLPGVRRMMDEFDIRSEPNRGTTVTVIKWK
jgi:serine/threonine-protein kinase RsbT